MTKEELKIQLALGTLELNHQIPNKLHLGDTQYKVPVRGRIFQALKIAVNEFKCGEFQRKDFASGDLDNTRVSFCEILGLIKRYHPYDSKSGRKTCFKITEVGKHAYKKLAKETGYMRKVSIDIEINFEALKFYARIK